VNYRYRIPPNFKRVLKKKPADMQAAVAECIRQLAKDPRHPGLHTHKMRGVKDVWEAYVDAGNRVTFEYDGDTIVMRNNCNHDILTRNP